MVWPVPARSLEHCPACLCLQHIKRRVLEEGALQPVIGLLSSACTESQREAALLLGQFATTDPDYKAKIVQRGAVPPLIEMLSHVDLQLKEMAAFALGRLAQNPENQAGIVQVHSSVSSALWGSAGSTQWHSIVSVHFLLACPGRQVV